MLRSGYNDRNTYYHMDNMRDSNLQAELEESRDWTARVQRKLEEAHIFRQDKLDASKSNLE